jgi:hypothetical protein
MNIKTEEKVNVCKVVLNKLKQSYKMVPMDEFINNRYKSAIPNN